MSETALSELECCAMPGCGSCQGLYTANTMACMTEAMGMSLSGCAAIPAVDAAKLRIARETGEAIMPLVKNQVRPTGYYYKKESPECYPGRYGTGGIYKYGASPYGNCIGSRCTSFP